MRAATSLRLGLGILALSCGSESESPSAGAGGTGAAATELVGAPGVDVTEVAIYQAVERVLWTEAGAPPAGVPLVAGREALVRVHYRTSASYDGTPVTARLVLDDGKPPLELEGTPFPVTERDKLETSINFKIPADRVGDKLTYAVTLGQPAAGRTENSRARASGDVVVEGHASTMRVMLVPFAYGADGSGRLPDTSEAEVERYRQRLHALYPVSKVEVSVHSPIDWQGAISPTGKGWQEVGMRVYQLRQTENVPDDVYLYGVFLPTQTLFEFCATGCMLGVTLLNDSPPDVGNVGLRLALGVGYPEHGPDTAAHELGHAHGRKHVNCGPGLDPKSIDALYPHSGNTIGDFGYDLTTGELRDPAVFSDFMGYCEKRWISGYNYSALFQRSQNVNLPDLLLPEGTYFDYWLVPVGPRLPSTAFQKVRRRTPLLGGRTVQVNADGKLVQGRYFDFDHLDGGWLFVPTSELARARFEIDGSRFDMTR